MKQSSISLFINPSQTGLFARYITGWPLLKFFNFQPFDFKLSTILLLYILDQNPKKKLKWRKFFNDVMIEWCYDVMTGGNMKTNFPPNWSYIIFRKSQKISGQTSKGFSKYATKLQPRARCPTRQSGLRNLLLFFSHLSFRVLTFAVQIISWYLDLLFGIFIETTQISIYLRTLQ